MRIAAALLVSLAGLFWAALSVDAATTHNVAIIGEDYSPVELTIAAGDTVTWTNPGGQAHNVRGSDGSFGSGFLTNGASFSHTFYTGGTYAYRCSIHPFMTGTVRVEGNVDPPSATATVTATPTAAPTAVPTPGPGVEPRAIIAGVARH